MECKGHRQHEVRLWVGVVGWARRGMQADPKQRPGYRAAPREAETVTAIKQNMAQESAGGAPAMPPTFKVLFPHAQRHPPQLPLVCNAGRWEVWEAGGLLNSPSLVPTTHPKA